MNTTPPAPLAVEALPVVAWHYRDDQEDGTRVLSLVRQAVMRNETALVRRSDAEAQLSTLRDQVARLERDNASWIARINRAVAAAEEVFGQDAIRYKLSLFKNGRARNYFPEHMDGGWFAFQRAEDDAHIGLCDEIVRLRSALKATPTRPIRTHGALPPPGAQTTPLPPFGPHPATQMRGGDPLDVEKVMQLADKVATRFHTFIKPGSTIEDGALWEAAREALRSALAGE